MTSIDSGILISASVLLGSTAVALSVRSFSRGILLLSTSCVLLVLVLAARSSQIGAASAALPVIFAFAAGCLGLIGLRTEEGMIEASNKGLSAGIGGGLLSLLAAWFGNPFVVLFVVLLYSAVVPVWLTGARHAAWAGLLFLFASLLLFAAGRFAVNGGASAYGVRIWAGACFLTAGIGGVILARGSLRERIGVVLPHLVAALCLLFRPDPG